MRMTFSKEEKEEIDRRVKERLAEIAKAEATAKTVMYTGEIVINEWAKKFVDDKEHPYYKDEEFTLKLSPDSQDEEERKLVRQIIRLCKNFDKRKKKEGRQKYNGYWLPKDYEEFSK